MIDNEATQILGGGQPNQQAPQGAPVNNQPAQAPINNSRPRKKDDRIEKGAFAAAGFVAGAASMAGVEAMANGKPSPELSDTGAVLKAEPEVKSEPEPVATQAAATTQAEPEKVTVQAEPQNTVNTVATDKTEPIINPADSPSEQDVIVATDEGVRVAQVDDNKPFAEAFADARAQVGAGGVFEWHGKVYGTYYKNEWEQMSSEERADWQAKIDYNDVRDEQEAQQYAQHSSHAAPAHQPSVATHASAPVADQASASVPSQETAPAAPANDYTNEELVVTDEGPADGEIHVIGEPEIVEGPDGDPLGVVVLEDGEGNQVMLVDVDLDGQFDGAIADLNGDGMISQNEVMDIQQENITLDDVCQLQAQQEGVQYTYNDGMPDYMNDADVSTMV